MMLDLPQPLGPTTPTSWPGTWKLVGSTKDLNPDNLMEVRRTLSTVLIKVGEKAAATLHTIKTRKNLAGGRHHNIPPRHICDPMAVMGRKYDCYFNGKTCTD
jgi:hypothetical protein